MYKTISKNEFSDTFHKMGRGKEFSYEGLSTLYDYLEEYEESTGEKMELDVIALCCDFAELTKKEIKEEYDMTLEELEENTTVLPVKKDTYIVQSF